MASIRLLSMRSQALGDLGTPIKAMLVPVLTFEMRHSNYSELSQSFIASLSRVLCTVFLPTKPFLKGMGKQLAGTYFPQEEIFSALSEML